MDTQPELKNSKDIIIYLSKRFPNCFSVTGDAKPLKIGIFQDLIQHLADEEQFSKTKLRSVLRSYTISWRYLYCIKEGAHRIDLDGNPGDLITASQAEYAQAQLKESKEKAKIHRKSVQKSDKEKPNRTTEPKIKNRPNNRINVPKPSAKSADNLPKTSLPKVNISDLKVNDAVKIIFGSKPLSATISSIEKENIKVKIPSGMELTVTVDRILL